MKDFKRHVAQALGHMGVNQIRIGGQVIECEQPEGLDLLEGYGDTIRPGDVVRVETSNWTTQRKEPVRVELIFKAGPTYGINVREVFEGPALARHRGCTHMLASGEGWTRTFKKLSPEDVAEWFWSRLTPGDGEYLLEHFGYVTVRDGSPVSIRRGSRGVNIQVVRELAEVFTRKSIKLAPKYSDEEKLVRLVSQATTFRF